jgi:hypothetical protein
MIIPQGLNPIQVGPEFFRGQPWQMCYRVVIRQPDGHLMPIRQRFSCGFVAESLADAAKMRASLLQLRQFSGLDLVICEWPERVMGLVNMSAGHRPPTVCSR